MTELAQRIEEMGVIRPGDKLVVRVQQGTSPDQVAEFSEQVKAVLPDVPVVFVAVDQALIVQTGESDGC